MSGAPTTAIKSEPWLPTRICSNAAWACPSRADCRNRSPQVYPVTLNSAALTILRLFGGPVPYKGESVWHYKRSRPVGLPVWRPPFSKNHLSKERHLPFQIQKSAPVRRGRMPPGSAVIGGVWGNSKSILTTQTPANKKRQAIRPRRTHRAACTEKNQGEGNERNGPEQRMPEKGAGKIQPKSAQPGTAHARRSGRAGR